MGGGAVAFRLRGRAGERIVFSFRVDPEGAPPLPRTPRRSTWPSSATWSPSRSKEETPYRKVPSDIVSVAPFEGQEVLKVAPEALTLVAREAFRDVSFLSGPRTSAKVAAILDDPEASRERPRRGPRAAAQRRGRVRLRAADVPGHGHRHDRREEGPAGLDRGPRRGAPLARRLRDLREGEPALLPDRPARRCTTRPTRARTCPPRSTSTRRTGWSTTSCSSRREGARRTRRTSSRRRRRS